MLKHLEKSIYLTTLCLSFLLPVLSANVKVIRIPEKIKIEENVFKETFVADLSKQEIFSPSGLHICDGKIFFFKMNKPHDLVVMDLNGKIQKKIARYGAGPCEVRFAWGVLKHKEKYIVNDFKGMKLIFFDKNLKCLDEFKVKNGSWDNCINNKNEIILGGGNLGLPYFHIYSLSGDFRRSFGKPQIKPDEYKKEGRLDYVKGMVYIPKKDGIWACFCNRYDLKYYEHEKLKIEINAKPDFFKIKKKKYQGYTMRLPVSYPIIIKRVNNHILYIYKMEGKICFCDVFDINSYRLKRRIKLNKSYRKFFGYHKDGIFYALFEDEEKESLNLYKLEFPLK